MANSSLILSLSISLFFSLSLNSFFQLFARAAKAGEKESNIKVGMKERLQRPDGGEGLSLGRKREYWMKEKDAAKREKFV